MKRSYIADNIASEYKRTQVYKNIQRQKCKQNNCIECKYNKFCTDYNIKEKDYENTITINE